MHIITDSLEKQHRVIVILFDFPELVIMISLALPRSEDEQYAYTYLSLERGKRTPGRLGDV